MGQEKVTNAALKKAGLITTEAQSVKILGGGEVAKKLTVELQAATVSAIAAIEKAGGTFTTTAVVRLKNNKKKAKEQN